MPSSSIRGKSWTGTQLKKIARRFTVSNILDIGCGEGTYVNNYKSIFPDAKWSGIEVWKPYIDKYHLREKYDTIINKDVRKVNFKKLRNFDIVFAGDVLEHMTKEESIKVVNDILAQSKCLLISIPIVHMPQGEYDGNPYEEHVKDDWSHQEVLETFGPYIVQGVCDEEIGAYILSKDENFIQTFNRANKIPNNIHFVFFGYTEFLPIHYASIKSAIEVHNPKKVYIYNSIRPTNNKHWDNILKNDVVEVVDITAPEEYNGVKLERFQYKADITRMELLIQQGGIYLDIDVVSLQSFEDLLDYPLVLGAEAADDPDTTDLNEIKSITNAVMLAEPNHPFMKEWFKQIGDNLENKEWAYHAVSLPLEILRQNTYDAKILPRKAFMPFDFRDDFIFNDDRSHLDKIEDSYTMHLWETIWLDKITNCKPTSLLAEIVKPYSYKPLKIAIYTICKNEMNFVDRWAASNMDADLRIVCDTGSTDDTVKKLESKGITVYNTSIKPWRFDVARNTALNLLPSDIDVCIWQDLDEELLPNWRQAIEKRWQEGTTVANHKYRHNDGNWQWHSKIHARHGCIWTGAVHETLKWFVPENDIWIDDFYLDEHQDVTKPRSSYLPLLLQKIEEGDNNWRTYFFLSNEYGNDFNKCLDAKLKSYEYCDEGDSLSKSYVARSIAELYSNYNQNDEAKQWYDKSLYHSKERETWFKLAQFYYKLSDWTMCFVASENCIRTTTKRNGFTYDSNAWGYLPYDLAALSAYHTGIKTKAIEYGRLALEMNPTDSRLLTNLEFYEEDVVIPLPDVLEIETNSTCNRTCNACLRNSHPDREKVSSWFTENLLPMETIKLIFEQAKMMGYKKDLGLSHFNEPLQDPRFVDIIKLAKSYPFKNVFFHSNGDLMTEELAKQIDGLVDWITFAVYVEGPAKEKRQAQLKSYFKRTEVRFTNGKLGLTHHGPSANLQKIIDEVKHLPCPEPSDRFIINHKGEMEFCCDDLGGNFGLGSVSENVTLHDLWFNKKFQSMVKQLQRKNGRIGLSYCESCPRPSDEVFVAKNIKIVTV